ncbi:hypothetical protein SAMN05428642_101371 [Flaviramulus basaltis]|uniref:Uncharacterized protein n=1 Tax=Flaviramulus basaltis TaxID=369401 RepID=A0A1K2IBB5_9FLAO|nr:hypothetical protein SAMN05428642_101371 [Flaviramulus basaltis]
MKKNGYNITLSTLTTIYFNQGIKLSQFFKFVKSKYSNKLNDSFILK